MDAETYILAPSQIADRARQLAGTGLYQQALDLLTRNCVEASIYPTRVEMKMATEHQRKYKFQQGNKFGRRKSPSRKD